MRPVTISHTRCLYAGLIVLLLTLDQFRAGISYSLANHQCFLPRKGTLHNVVHASRLKSGVSSLRRTSITCNSQDRAPLVEALVRAADCVKAPFFFPGHQMGRGFPQIFVDKLLHGISHTSDPDISWQAVYPVLGSTNASTLILCRAQR